MGSFRPDQRLHLGMQGQLSAVPKYTGARAMSARGDRVLEAEHVGVLEN